MSKQTKSYLSDSYSCPDGMGHVDTLFIVMPGVVVLHGISKSVYEVEFPFRILKTWNLTKNQNGNFLLFTTMYA